MLRFIAFPGRFAPGVHVIMSEIIELASIISYTIALLYTAVGNGVKINER